MKVLIIRLSSIGDIILTTPVVRCIKQQLGAEIHFLVKKSFANVLAGNPYIDQIHYYERWDEEAERRLREEQFDHIFDLHKNLRSKQIIYSLKLPSTDFDKLNVRKWFMTALKINILPKKHIVDRYFEALERFGLKYDGKGLDFFISDENITDADRFLNLKGIPDGASYVAMAIGAARKTKLPTIDLYIQIINRLGLPVVLLGGPGDKQFGEEIANSMPASVIVNAAGELTLQESVAVLKRALCLVTPDTGLMHAGAAMGTPMVVIWGNTIPEFGMYPLYKDNTDAVYHNHEVYGLSCRPCSKIGYEHCPKKHFHCMKQQNMVLIVKNIESLINSRQKKHN